MPDQNFFERRSPLALKEISGVSGCDVAAGSDPAFKVHDVAPLDKAAPTDVSFFDNIRYKEQFETTKAGACIVSPAMVKFAPKGTQLLVSNSPYKSYALVAQLFYPEHIKQGSISPKAVVDPSAKIGRNCLVEAGVVIGPGAVLGDECWIEANAVIGRNVRIGNHCRVGANASVSHALIGDHVRLYPGVRVGQDGFGFAMDPAGHVKIPQLGRVIIEDHVEVGANTCIDRGSGPDTVIGQGTWIDNLVQIAHNVKIGKGCVIVAQVGISGSAVIGDFVALGGQVGVLGHLTIGRGARVAAQSGIFKDVPEKADYMGYPAIPKRQYLRQVGLLNRLIKKEKSS